MVQVAEGVGLDLGVLGLPDAGAEPVGGPGRVFGVEQAGDQRQQRTHRHPQPGAQDAGDVLPGHPHVDDVAHQHRNDHLEAAFHHHQQHPQGHVLSVGAHIPKQAFEVFHTDRFLPRARRRRPVTLAAAG